jgi:CBS domain containing-hemolysin-like protein
VSDGGSDSSVLSGWLRSLLGARNGDSSLRETISELIEEIEESEDESEAGVPFGSHEKVLLTNIVRLRHLTAYDVMIPRADIIAIDESTDLQELLTLVEEEGHSRLPVFKGTLDEVIGFIHIRDIIPYATKPERFRVKNILRELPVVAPSMRVLDLLLEMRLRRTHMALIVDEYGGIDGLITIEDLVEEIVGEIEDEHDVDDEPRMKRRPDGALMADARLEIDDFEEQLGPILSDEEREEDIDTLGGLVFHLAGRVPARGELIEHPNSGIVFEVVQADPRRIKRLRIRNEPMPKVDQGEEEDG